MKPALYGIVEIGKTVMFRGNFIWHLARVTWGSIMLGFSIRVGNFPAAFNICKAIITACQWMHTRGRRRASYLRS